MNILVALIILAGIVIYHSVKYVPQGHAYNIHRLGSYKRTLTYGFNYIMPFIDTITHRLALTGHELTVKPQKLNTFVNGPWQIQGKIFYQILDAAQADADADHLDELVMDAGYRAINDVLRETEQDNTSAQKNALIRQTMNRALASHGLLAVRCELTIGKDADATPLRAHSS